MFSIIGDAAQEVCLPLDALRDFVIKTLVKKSAFQFDAQTTADRLIESNLRGRPESGVRLLPAILEAMDQGEIDPRARVLTENETPAIATLDGSRALGPVAATQAMELAIKKGLAIGIGAVAVHHSQDLGAVSNYSILAANAGLIGFCTTSFGGTCTAVPGTSHGSVACTRLAWAIPTGVGKPIVVDVGSSTVSRAQLQILQQYGLPLPPGAALTADGREAGESGDVAVLQPLAGPLGAGLSIVSSLLSSGLAGGKQPHQKTRSPAAECAEHFLMAIDIAQFTDREKFFTRTAAACQALREQPPLDPAQPVTVPGSEAWEREAMSREHGVRIHRADLEALAHAVQKLKIDLPWQATD